MSFFTAPRLLKKFNVYLLQALEQEKDEIFESSVETISKLDIPSYDMV